MKNLFILVFGIICSVTTLAQQRDVISAAGDDVNVDGVAMSFTIGETVVEMANNDSVYLTAGFQQSNIIISNALPKEEIKIKAKVFPNPAINFFYIEINQPENSQFFIVLHNTKGQFILRQNVNVSPLQVSLAGLPNGVYYLTVLNNSNERMHQFKVLKTE